MPTFTPIQQRLRDAAGQDRRCVKCARPAYGLGELCRRHRRQRRRTGSTRHVERLNRETWSKILPLVTAYMTQNPPPPEATASMMRVMEPGAPLAIRDQRDSNPAWVLQRELLHWHSPSSAKKYTEAGKYDYSPAAILAALVSIMIYVIERDGRGFPERSEHFTLAKTLIKLKRRPRRPQGQTGHKVTKPIPHSALEGLANRLKDSAALMYVGRTAYKIIEARKERNAELALALHENPDLLEAEPTPTTHPELFIEVRTRRYQVLRGGNDDGFVVDTGFWDIIYRRRRPEDGDLPFVIGTPPTRPAPKPVEMEPYRFRDNDGRQQHDARVAGPGSQRTLGERRPDSSGRRYGVHGFDDVNAGVPRADGRGV